MAKRGKPERREPRFGRGLDDRVERAERQAAGRQRTERPRRGKVFAPLVRLFVVMGIWVVVAGAAVVAYEAAQLPPIDQLVIPKRPPNIAILARDATLLANRGDMGGAAVKLADLPTYLPQAFIAIEDRRFYAHFGLDPIGIARAIVSDVVLRRGMQGGSTLTQQLAKNLFLTQERTVSRKIQEAILAVWLEHKFSKRQILELYLNRVYFGSGAFGVEAAARKYFNIEARQVTLAQAAMLAGLMKAPTKLAPNRNPEAAIERAAQVIAAMHEAGFISDDEAKAALAAPAHVVRPPGSGAFNYAADYVVDSLDDLIGSVDQDIVVESTIDRQMELDGERALTDELAKKGGRYGVSQGAMVAEDPEGAIRVLIGGRDYGTSQFNRAVAAKRQPGSAFKPFVYLAGIEKGLTPDTIREDGPINVRGWRPEDYARDYLGPVTLSKALAQSLNTVAVRVCLEAGPRQVVSVAHRLGIASELQANASIALGTSEVTPLELVNAYVPFANGGIGVQPHVINRIKTTSGRLLYQRRTGNNGRVIAPRDVAMMNAMMTETLLSGTARKGAIPGWQTGGKTGTSQDFRDAWFVGYASPLVAGVWLGNDDSSPTKKASGGTLPVEIWSRFMREALAGRSPTPLPYGLSRGAPASVAAPAPASGRPSFFGIPLPGGEPVAALPPRHPMETVSRSGEPVGGPLPEPPSRRARVDSAARDLIKPDDLPPGRVPVENGSGSPPHQKPGGEPSLVERFFGSAL
jgi:penicillin-binding protein 1A